MSVDKDIFYKLAEVLDTNLDELIYGLCENVISFIPAMSELVNERPAWELYNTDPEEYARLSQLYRDEISKIHDDCKNEWGYEHIEQEGGGEGGGEHCYGVFKLKDKLYRAEYSYYSYNGHEYDGIFDTIVEVEPKEVMVVQYVEVE